MAIRIGTRKSLLALAQTNIVIDKLKEVYPGIKIEVVEIATTGDKLYNANLALIGGKGLFLKEIEELLLLGNIDIAVHSMKDVPVQIPEGLIIDCVLEREDARDAFVSSKYEAIKKLPVGAIIGTSSARRKEQLLIIRPDLNVIPFRGNVNTRISKVEQGEVDACLLALAGLKRISLEKHAKEILPTDVMIPAVCQGIICIEHRMDDSKTAKLLSLINHEKTMLLSKAERAFMTSLQGNCTTPLAANAVLINDKQISINAGYFDINSKRFIKTTAIGGVQEPEAVGYEAANKIKKLLSN